MAKTLAETKEAIAQYFGDKSRSPSETYTGLQILQEDIQSYIDALKADGVCCDDDDDDDDYDYDDDDDDDYDGEDEGDYEDDDYLDF